MQIASRNNTGFSEMNDYYGKSIPDESYDQYSIVA